jgi:hypothetical protein
MAQMPVEVVIINRYVSDSINQAIRLANSLQDEVSFTTLPIEEAQHFYMHAFNHMKSTDFLNAMEHIKQTIRGFHPFMIAIVEAAVDGPKYSNLFGSYRSDKGIAFFTTHNVLNLIVPEDRIHCYVLYYLARYTLSFIVPRHKNHDDTRECVFDRKIIKTDILKSMRSRPFCDECRKSLVYESTQLSPKQFAALEILFETTKILLEKGYKFVDEPLKNTSALIQEIDSKAGSTLSISTGAEYDILHEKYRRLNALRIQQARFGYETSPHVITEIEDLEQQIAELRRGFADQ